MQRFAAIALVPLFAGYLCGQEANRSEVTTTTTWNGTLIDNACRTTHTTEKSTDTSKPDPATTQTKTTTPTKMATPKMATCMCITKLLSRAVGFPSSRRDQVENRV